MGFLEKITGVVPREQPPILKSFFPPQAVLQVNNGKLPTLSVDKLFLLPNEICHFVDVAALITEKKRRKTAHVGGSIRVAKGLTAHVGQSQSVPISEPHYTKGIFYITNQRMVFVAHQNGFDKKIQNLTAVVPYADAVLLQFGNKSYSLLLPDGAVTNTVIQALL